MNVAPILSALLSRGGEYGELFYEEVRTLTVLLEDGKVERVLAGTDAGVGVRLLCGGKTFYAFTNAFDPASLAALAGDLSRHAAGGKGDPLAVPASASAAASPSPVRVDPATRGVNEKVGLVTLIDRVARGESPSVRQVRASYGEAERTIEVAAHPGVFAADRQTYTVLAVQCVAGGGSGLAMGYESGGGTLGYEFLEEFVPETLARKAAGRAVRTLSAAKLPGGKMPVVLSAEAGGTM